MKLIALSLALLAGSAAAQAPTPRAQPSDDDVLKAQVMLDRAHFSVGEIDGIAGTNMMTTLKAFQQDRAIEVTGELDQATFDVLEDGKPVMQTVTLTEKEVGGKYGANPLYRNKMEKLGEEFQTSPELLKKLNPNASFVAGESITVPNVGGKIAGEITKIVVNTTAKTLIAYDQGGKILGYYPTTLGNDDTIPYGEHTVNSVSRNPTYRHKDSKTGKILAMGPGPNNYVGNVWMALSEPHYGIHGSPEPSKIARQESHGCIRLTNWDANEVANTVGKKAVVVVEK